ncbi:MAG TPA: hypothetical protein PK771_14180 [Spirochaetota bacterium]|nr:hypothetical protein [Spirochaetota bacterium]
MDKCRDVMDDNERPLPSNHTTHTLNGTGKPAHPSDYQSSLFFVL